jgi:hypothetical protein
LHAAVPRGRGTDPFEASIAASSLGQHVIADGLARAVELYFAQPG